MQHRPQEARVRVRLYAGGREVRRWEGSGWSQESPQIEDTGVLEDVEGLMGGRVGVFCKSQVAGCSYCFSPWSSRPT